MKKVFSLVLLLCTLSVSAIPVSFNDARNAAFNVLRHYCNAPDNANIELISFGMKSQNPELYIFNAGNHGFVILAGDDAVAPILGFSSESAFPGMNVPPSLNAMLNGFAEQIRYVREHELKANQTITDQWNAVFSGNFGSEKGFTTNQLLTCLWDQGSPYNALCPYDPAGPGDRVYAGCVATAMAMTMYYYRYPEQPTGFHGYNSSYGYLSVDFSQSHYSYEQMPYKLTSFNYDAAKIQYDCGVAVDMMYSPSGSGAYMDDALNAMIDHFGYNPGASLDYKNSYSETDWKNMLKTQINAGHPLPYAGYDVSAGHAFVCDGYIDDMFHFNWGWSGSYNGYFYIDNLNPGYNFSSGQQAFFNCFPSAVTYPMACADYHMTTRSGSLVAGHGLSGYGNNQDCSWLIEPTDSVEYISLEFRYLSTESINDTVTIYAGTSESDPIVGTYSGSTTPPIVTVDSNKVFVTFKSNSSITAGGFHADYYAYTPPFCSIMTIHTDSAGTINDGSHAYAYNNNSVCRWKIEPEHAQGIMIDFTEFSLEEGLDILSFYQYPSYVLVDSLTGYTLPQSFFINSPTAMVIFKSNSATTDAGFTFNYHGVATGLNEYSDATMSLFVNDNSFPVLNISHFPTGNYTIELTDIMGRKLFSQQWVLSGGSNRIEIPYAPENAGLYLISLKGSQLSQTLKFFAK